MTGKRILASAVLVPVGVVVALYWLVPGLFLEPLIKANRALSGLSADQVQVGDHNIHYLKGGEGEQTLVLLHGIFAEKDHWVEFARPLKDDFRVIIPDLPGFGESTRLEDASYHYGAQSQRLHQFLRTLDLEQVHLAGNSMGGGIVARFALDYPEQVQSLAFIGAPHGINSPIESEMERRLASGEIPLIAQSDEEFERLLDFLFVEIPWLPRPVYQHSLNHAVSRAESNMRLWNQQQDDPFRLDDHLEALDLPVLTLWGEQEQVFHVSGIEVLRERLPNGIHEVMEQTGHLPMMEYPARTGSRYREFVSNADKN